MKIAFVNDTFLSGRGADSVIYELAKRLGKEHEVFIISSKSDIPEKNFKILKLKTRKLLLGNTMKDSLSYIPNIIKFRREVLRLHKEYSFDLINVHHSSLNPAFINFPAPIIVTWHGTPPSRNKIRVLFNKMVLQSLRSNKISITISEYMKRKLANSVSGIKIKVIGHGVKDELNFSQKDGGYMFFVGRFERHKGIDELIRISREVDFPLILAGCGPLEDSLKKYAKNIKANKVFFLGKISDKKLVNLYQRCSFLVSASKWEGFGLIFIEAAACGKPSLGYRKGAIPEVILNRKTGFMVEDFIGLRKRTKELIKDKKLRKRIGKQAFIFSRRFNWDKSAREYEKIFLEVKDGLEE